MATQKITFEQAIKEGKAKLDNRAEAELLFCNAAGISKSYLYAHHDEWASTEVLQKYEHNLALRKKGMPVAYITGSKEFWSLDFNVNQHTLIPRPETELLVEVTLEKLKNKDMAAVVELGVGSGAVIIALAKERPRWQLYGTDFSHAALQMARQNAVKHEVNNLVLLQSDWFETLPAIKFDAIISNPPYIALQDPHLSDLSFEPLHALVAGEDGLDAIRIIVKDSMKHLQNQGWLLLEHGYDQGESVRLLMARSGYQHISTVKDINGHERITMGQINNNENSVSQ